jgi:hypothetical protein
MPKLLFLPFLSKLLGIIAAVAAIAGLIFRGPVGGLGAAAGVGVAAAGFVLSAIGIAWVESVNRAMMLPAALMAYMLKIAAFAMILSAVGTWTGAVPMALGIAAGVLGWVIGYAWWLWHAKIPYVDVS